jgi:phosphatidylserine decarboxylase
MATLDVPAGAPPREAPIRSIQPGGGLGFSLELAWGRLRRAVLRRFFPAYVQRMTAVRQGHCPDCPHDVIDPRDLKLVRNVCGYRFRPEDDAFAWRGRLGLARAGLAEVILFSLLLVPAILASTALGVWLHPLWLLPLAVLVPLWLFTLAFFRDPHRVIPAEVDALISPADGVITHLEEIDADFPGGRAFRVSIFLSVFNVHVNRMPRPGRVKQVRYYPGEFLDARSQGCHVRNEQLWIDFEDEQLGCPVRVKQIAGAIARRIVCWLAPGETVSAGERFGMIKFGSRTDVFVPAEAVAEVRVRIGEAVRGGSTVLLLLRGEFGKAPRAPASEGPLLGRG